MDVFIAGVKRKGDWGSVEMGVRGLALIMAHTLAIKVDNTL